MLSRSLLLTSLIYLYVFVVPTVNNDLFKLLSFSIFSLSIIASYNSFSLINAFSQNRSALLIPFISASVAFFLKYINEFSFIAKTSIKSIRFWSRLIILISIALVVLFYSSSRFWDSYGSQLSAFYSVYFDPIRSLNRIDSAGSYFSLDTSYLGFQSFINLRHWLGVFYPRQIFTDKDTYDISLILWNLKIYPQPLYYEPFLNMTLDLKVFGVAFYSYVLFLFFHAYAFTIGKSRPLLRDIGLSSYIVSIVLSQSYFQTVSFLQSPLLILLLLYLCVTLQNLLADF